MHYTREGYSPKANLTDFFLFFLRGSPSAFGCPAAGVCIIDGARASEVELGRDGRGGRGSWPGEKEAARSSVISGTLSSASMGRVDGSR